MPEHLMSVRFDQETLDLLRTLADVHDSNIAEEIRAAVKRYLEQVRGDEDFRRDAKQAIVDRQRRIDALLGTG